MSGCFTLNSDFRRYVCSSYTCNECRRTLNRNEQWQHRAVSLRQHGSLVPQFFSKAKKRSSAIPLSSDAFYLENPGEYPHEPYIARNWSSSWRFALRRYAPIFIGFDAFSKIQSRTLLEPARKQNLTENSHSRSFWDHRKADEALRIAIIMLALSLKFPKK